MCLAKADKMERKFMTGVKIIKNANVLQEIRSLFKFGEDNHCGDVAIVENSCR